MESRRAGQRDEMNEGRSRVQDPAKARRLDSRRSLGISADVSGLQRQFNPGWRSSTLYRACASEHYYSQAQTMQRTCSMPA